ncbi:hypothetical protein, partial [Cyclobacterium jeungdonense]
MKNKISYTLRKLSEKEYKDAPEEVRKVYIHVTEKIPMDGREKARILRSHPEYFTRKKPLTFAQKVRHIHNRQSKIKRNEKAR